MAIILNQKKASFRSFLSHIHKKASSVPGFPGFLSQNYILNQNLNHNQKEGFPYTNHKIVIKIVVVLYIQHFYLLYITCT